MFRLNGLFLIFIVILFGSLSNSCKNDPKEAEDPIIQDYFEDYEVPNFKWGFINKSGKTIVKSKFDQVKSFNEHRAAVNYEGKWGFINPVGTKVIDTRYMKVSSFSNGMALVKDFDGSIFYLDTLGNQALKVNYNSADNFHNNIAKINENGYYGYINKQGKLIIKAQFNQGWSFYTKHSARVKKDQHYVLINRNGQIISQKKDKIYTYSDGYFRYKKNNKYGLLDSLGNDVFDDVFDYLSSVKFGKLIIQNDSIWTLYNLSTNQKLADFNDQVHIIGEHQLRYKVKNKYGILSHLGDTLSQPIFTQINSYAENLAIALVNDRWVVIDNDGGLVSNKHFGLLWDFNEGIAKAMTDEGIGFINKELEFIHSDKYLEAKGFHQGKAAIKTYNQ